MPYQASAKRWLMTDWLPPSEFQAHHGIPQHFSMKHTILNLLNILRSNSGDPSLCFHTRLKPGWDPGLLKDPVFPSKSTMFFSSHPSCLFCPSPRSLELNHGPQYHHRKQGEQRSEILGFDLAFFPPSWGFTVSSVKQGHEIPFLRHNSCDGVIKIVDFQLPADFQMCFCGLYKKKVLRSHKMEEMRHFLWGGISCVNEVGAC